MLYKQLIVGATLAILIAVPVFADQAAWVTREEAARALEILAKHQNIKHYCAPCQDQEVIDEKIVTIGLFPVGGQNYWEIRINGKGVDLAYIYFESKKDKWSNVAIKAKIDVHDVPKELSSALLATSRETQIADG